MRRSYILGFTLIELLVVIAIIAILMGILVPVLGRVREQGRDVVCHSNLRQIGLAANMYADEFDLRIPRGAAGNTDRAWYQLFMPYLAQKPVGNDYRSVKIYRCPSYPNKQQTVCFVVNGWAFTNPNDAVGREITTPTRITDAEQKGFTIYLTDNEDGSWRSVVTTSASNDTMRCDVWNPGHLPTSTSQDVTYGRRVARARHRNKNGCNVLFLDWHAEWMPPDKVVTDLWRFDK